MNAAVPQNLPYRLPLSPSDRKELKGLAHHLDAVVMIGDKGLSATVLFEIEIALKAHALIKIKVAGDDRDARLAMLDAICGPLKCEKVQTIGKLLVVYRPKPVAAVKEHVAKKLMGSKLAAAPRRKMAGPRKPLTKGRPNYG